MEKVFALVPREEMFARTGIQFLALNTLYQLYAHARAGLPGARPACSSFPTCHRHLCGSFTAGSRTPRAPARGRADRALDDELFAASTCPGLDAGARAAGTPLGRLRRRGRPLGRGRPSVLAPATHDTGSAVAGTPLQPGWAFLSSGTWSLLGVERESPLFGEESPARTSRTRPAHSARCASSRT